MPYFQIHFIKKLLMFFFYMSLPTTSRREVHFMPILDWLGKDKVINHHLHVPFHFLDKKYSVGSSENKIIHGDNLLALKSLLPEYRGKVKCIYIDPP